jgi:ABC-type transporter Mla MlaB component
MDPRRSDVVLRITRDEAGESGVSTLRVAGRLVADSVEVLENECRRSLHGAPRVRLDLAGVTFIDGRGVSLLGHLRGPCLEIVNCPWFVEGLLSGADNR